MSLSGNKSAGLLAVSLAFSLLLGCQSSQPTAEPGPRENDGVSGAEILAEVIQQYQTAESYADNAMLYLNYRIDGRLIQEPQPWSVRWSQDGGFSTRFFNSQVQFDGLRMSCFVFDIDSGNLDDQQWVTRTTRPADLDRLFLDPIGQHFLCGFSELPLDESDKSLANSLVSPILRLCSGSQTNEWLTANTPIQRSADQVIDGVTCYVVQLTTDNGVYELFVNQQSGLIEQLIFPVNYLDQQVRSADAIVDVKLFARFHDAQLNPQIEADAFQVQRREHAKVVRQFITIPEPFPSEWIGRRLPELKFQEPDGTPFSTSGMSGKTTALFWFANDLASLKQFAQLSSSTGNPKQSFYAVYSDAELATPGAGSSEPASAVREAVAESSPAIRLLYDPQMSASIQLKLATVPAVLVVGPDLKLQFVQGIKEADWPQRLTAAMQRIENGEDVAHEMQVEYEKYRRQYDDQLAANDHSDVFGDVAGVDGLSKKKRAAVSFQRTWESADFVSAGNLISRQGKLYVLDGFQTITTLDHAGQRVATPIPLKLPESQGINRLRGITTSDGKNWFAGFSMLGRSAFVFDENWELVYQYPAATVEHDGISDVQLVSHDSDTPELWVAFVDDNGIHQVDMISGNTVVATQQATKSLNGEQTNLYVSGDQVRRLRDASAVDQNLKYKMLSGDPRISIAMGTDSQNRWNVVGISPETEVLWQRRAGEQYFESHLESLAISANQNWLAIADAEGRVELMDFEGNLIGHHRFEQPIQGIAWLNDPAGTGLAVSFADHVELWQIDPSPFRTVSGDITKPPQ